MKNGKVNFQDFKKFMKFLGAWTKYQKEMKRNGLTPNDMRDLHAHTYIFTVIWTKSGEDDSFWSEINNMWSSYVYMKEMKKTS